MKVRQEGGYPICLIIALAAMHPLTYLHLQMQLEGNILLGDRLTREMSSPPDEKPPLMLLARLTTQEVIAYYNESVSTELKKKLAASVQDNEFPQIHPILNILNSQNMRTRIDHFITYVFPTQPADSIDTDVRRLDKQVPRLKALGFDSSGAYVFAMEIDDRIVCACGSARENDQCGVAWVQTEPEYRRQGLAQKVVRTWARSLMDARKIPFFSHPIEDSASAVLADRLGLQPVFEEISISALPA
jgi:hypothetical protein